MTIKIAGRSVKKGDSLYHIGLRAWGVVDRLEAGSAVILISGANGAQRFMYVQAGGMVNQARAVFWHEPIALDLPTHNIDAVQRIVDTVVAELYP